MFEDHKEKPEQNGNFWFYSTIGLVILSVIGVTVFLPIKSVLFTVDSDFHIYRKNGKQPILLVIPDSI